MGMNRLDTQFKLLVFVLGMQVITLGVVANLWLLEMGQSVTYAHRVLALATVGGLAVTIVPFVVDAVAITSEQLANGGEN